MRRGGDVREMLASGETLFALLAGLTGVAGSFAVAGATPRFVVAPVNAVVIRTTPGALVAWLIQNVGDPAHLLHVTLSIAIVVGSFGALAWVGIRLGRRHEVPTLGALLSGLLVWGLATALAGEPRLALGAAVPAVAFTALGARGAGRRSHDRSRRRVLGAVAGAIALVGASVGVGRVTTAAADTEDAEPVSEPVAELLALAEDRSLDLAGENLPGLVSETGEFYNVDIAQYDPEVPADDWSLSFTGEVGRDLELGFADLTAMPVEHRFLTLRCVGEPRNGRKLDTAVWTGTPIKPLLDEVDPGGACGCVMVRAEDDYFVQFPVEALEDGFLAWGMNGRPLPRSHGHPVRVLVPGHWGETNVKWISEIELLSEAADGYWEQRGWAGTGPVTTVAKLWDQTRLPDGRVELAGHAYAGTRGVSGVEVSFDGGASWRTAEVSEPLPGTDVWRQWRYVVDPDGRSRVVVRAIEADGTVQPEARTNPKPSGATGWVSARLRG